ncbi:sigma-70 family RNA polymerase sigma factor [Methylobacterium sp. E-005]|nr:sigma-70 family RNA polymerase sigma factor [Methylobacterium sp. E-005]MCJ2090240.1 sigma-70 family RNA polymerase sigma factor [Methylobacterium sp. E-005]
MILAVPAGLATCGWSLALGSEAGQDAALAGERNGGGARMALEEELAGLMASAQRGDAAAYRALLKACLPVVSAIARAQGVRGEAVDDVVQDTLMTVHRARASYDPARPFMPWLRAITQRRAIDRLRRAGRRPREVNDPLAYEAEIDPGPAPSQSLEARDRAAALARAVASLPEGQRQAVEQLGLRELSLDEAAALTGRSKGALKVNLHRALKALRTSLTREAE